MGQFSDCTEAANESSDVNLAAAEFPEYHPSFVYPHRQVVMLTLEAVDGISAARASLIANNEREPTLSELLDYIIACWQEGTPEH
jgi:hypothetical protein